MARRGTRELAFTMIFQADFAEADYGTARENFDNVDEGFLSVLVEGVKKHRDKLDQIIAQYTKGWSVSRLPRVDRALLRLGAWELLGTDTPPAVAINEAVELAKNYGNEDSPRFINAVLDRIRAERQQLSGSLEG